MSCLTSAVSLSGLDRLRLAQQLLPALPWCVSATSTVLYTRCDLGSLADVAGAVIAASGVGIQPLTGILLGVRCDLGSLADVNDAVRTTTHCGAQPLTGVVHAGGVLEDASLRNQTAAHVRHVFAPKLSAAMGLGQVRAGVNVPQRKGN